MAPTGTGLSSNKSSPGDHTAAPSKPENAATVQEDVQYQAGTGFSQIFTWDEVQIMIRTEQVKVSPMAVIPQKDHRGRIILDLSLTVYPERAGICT
jgi:hypothetical protein